MVITSNREKRLPEPFLRRCLYVRSLRSSQSSVDELQDIVRKNIKLSHLGKHWARRGPSCCGGSVSCACGAWQWGIPRSRQAQAS